MSFVTNKGLGGPSKRHQGPLLSGIELRDVEGCAGFEGEIVWDTSKSDGQPRRRLDTSRAKREFDFEAKVTFWEGLKHTIEWYENHQEKIAS